MSLSLEELNRPHSREALAGYDREKINSAEVFIAGGGAAGNNSGLDLALVGVNLRIADYDRIDPSNLTRSPLFRREGITPSTGRAKARELADRCLALSYHPEPVMRFAVAKVQALGLGAFAGTSAILSAVDTLEARAYLADASRLLAIPLIEVGFSAGVGHVTVWPNRSAEDACWRCLHPATQSGGLSCTAAARAVIAEGRIPNTQPTAAAFSAIAAEHVLRAVHGEFPLAEQMFSLNLLTGRSLVMGIECNPTCPGAHRILGAPLDVDVGVEQSVAELLAAVSKEVAAPVLHLPSPFVIATPCPDCGASVRVGKPLWDMGTPPSCDECRPEPRASTPVVLHDSSPTDTEARRVMKRLGIAPGTIVDVEDSGSGRIVPVRLRGGLGDLFVTRRRA
jgi:molybdopterin/thiamine biosynthesis adenylyltransferase